MGIAARAKGELKGYNVNYIRRELSQSLLTWPVGLPRGTGAGKTDVWRDEPHLVIVQAHLLEAWTALC